MRNKNYVTSIFICTECEMRIPLPREQGRQRARGHKKDLFCPKCKETRIFAEVGYKDAWGNLDGEKLEV